MAVQAKLCTHNIGGFHPSVDSPDWNTVDNNLSMLFCSDLPQKSSQQQQLLQQMQDQQMQTYNQSLFFHNNLLAPKNSNLATDSGRLGSMGCFQSQWQEIDRFIMLHNERLRLLLQEQRKLQIVELMKRIESKTSVLIRQKEEEFTKAARKTIELEILLKRLEMDNQTWKRLAQENEAMVVSLNNTLEEMREKASYCFNNGADDAESTCEVNREERDDEKIEETGERKGMLDRNTTMVCRSCDSRNSCVLFLPCRHLCTCKECERFLDSCPVCRTSKKYSIEVLIF